MQSEGFLHLLYRAQQGDGQAVESLMAAARPHMEEIARSYGAPSGNDVSRSDVVQVAWLRAWERLDQFRGAGTDEEACAAFLAWLAQILRTSLLNQKRDRNRQWRQPDRPLLSLDGTAASGRDGKSDPAAAEATPATRAVTEEEGRLVREAVEGLPDPVAREILWLRFVDQLSLREISHALSLDYHHVRQRFHQSLDQLEEQLGGILRQEPD